MSTHTYCHSEPARGPIEFDQEVLDLVDQMAWEDNPKVHKYTLEEVGLEESNPTDNMRSSSIWEYMMWFYDDEIPGISEE